MNTKLSFIIVCFSILTLFICVSCAPTNTQNHGEQKNTSSVPITKRDDVNRSMDMIMWYDCDGWVSSMQLNPNHPEKPKKACRAADTFFGPYSRITDQIALQHSYWIYSLGCNVICADWTNYISYRQTGNNISYNKKLYNNTDTLLSTLSTVNTFDTPSLYVAIRLSDNKTDELAMKLDDVYKLYEKYKDSWYLFNDGTDKSNKPFIVIFTDVFDTGEKWYDRLNNTWSDDYKLYEDPRFNIRWSNGYLGVMTKKDEKGWNYIPKGRPYWTFVEPYVDKTKEDGYYEVFYSNGLSNGIEQMSCWASMFKNNMTWDALNNVIDGKTTFERTLRGASELKPKALLINRFNYPLAWPEEPQEGLSLYESTHIEPNKDFGFEVFNNVAINLYNLNSWEKMPPTTPEFNVSESITELLRSGQKVFFSLKDCPQEYRISFNSNMNESKYVYYNLTKGIEIPKNMLDSNARIYIQTRNSFGESSIIALI